MSLTASIIIPAYNASAFLHEAIASAQAQTVRDIEILVVDDCSTDGTWDLATSFAARDPRVIPLRRTRRGGPSAACNTGIECARGRWIAVLDADDLYLPERIERLVALGEERGADLIADNLLERDFDTGADLGLHFPEAILSREEPLSLAEMLHWDMPDLPGRARMGYVQPVKRREFLLRAGIRFAEDVEAGEDFLFYFECVARGGRFHLTPEAYYVYRLRRGSVSNRAASAPHYSAANRRMLTLARRLSDPGLLEALLQRQELLDYSSFVYLLEEGEVLRALSYVPCRSSTQLLARFRAVRSILAPPRVA